MQLNGVLTLCHFEIVHIQGSKSMSAYSVSALENFRISDHAQMARRAHAADRDVSQSFPQPLDDDVELKRQAFQRFELVFLLFEN